MPHFLDSSGGEILFYQIHIAKTHTLFDYLSVIQLLKALAITRAASSIASTFWLLNLASISACVFLV